MIRALTHFHNFVQKLKFHLQDGYKLKIEYSDRNSRIIQSELSIGDRVLVMNMRLRGKHKLADKWEAIVYTVVYKAITLPMYTLREEGIENPLRALHRHFILPCRYLPAQEP